MNPDRRSPKSLREVLDWPQFRSVYAPKVRARMHEINGGCRLVTTGYTIRHSREEWRR